MADRRSARGRNGSRWSSASTGRRLKGSGSSGRIIERDIRAAAAQAASRASDLEINISPVARRVAQEAGISPGRIGITLPRRPHHPRRCGKSSGERAADAAPERQPLSRIRRLTRDRMVESARATAPVTLTTEADATELHQMRRKLKSRRRRHRAQHTAICWRKWSRRRWRNTRRSTPPSKATRSCCTAPSISASPSTPSAACWPSHSRSRPPVAAGTGRHQRRPGRADARRENRR